MSNKVIGGIIAILVLVIAGAYYMGVRVEREAARIAEIDSFEECAEAGYPIMESYPEQCATPDGRSFTRELDEPISPIIPSDDADTGTSDDTSTPTNPNNPPAAGNGGGSNPNPGGGTACTMDAYQCPDGTWVGRTGPQCQFICP